MSHRGWGGEGQKSAKKSVTYYLNGPLQQKIGKWVKTKFIRIDTRGKLFGEKLSLKRLYFILLIGYEKQQTFAQSFVKPFLETLWLKNFCNIDFSFFFPSFEVFGTLKCQVSSSNQNSKEIKYFLTKLKSNGTLNTIENTFY